MPKHTWSTSVKTDNGAGPVDSIDLYGSAEQNIGGTALGSKGLAVGAQDVEQVDIAITVNNIISFFVKSTTDMRLRTNSETAPSQEVNLTAGKAFGWNNASIPQPSANPLTVNITSLYFYNLGTVNGVTPTGGLSAGTVSAGFLLSQETLFS